MNARVQDVPESAQSGQEPYTADDSLTSLPSGEDFVEFVREQPLAAVAMAAIVGFLLGQIIGR